MKDRFERNDTPGDVAGDAALLTQQVDYYRARASEYDYQVQDGQQYIKEAKSKTWRRPSPGENTPSGDPGMGNLADIVRRAQAIQPYRLTRMVSLPPCQS